jgi:hypothetical protein
VAPEGTGAGAGNTSVDAHNRRGDMCRKRFAQNPAVDGSGIIEHQRDANHIEASASIRHNFRREPRRPTNRMSMSSGQVCESPFSVRVRFVMLP